MSKIIFGVSSSFINPFLPCLNDKITFKCIVPKKNSLLWIRLCFIEKDFIKKVYFNFSKKEYTCEVIIKEENFRFWLEYRTNSGNTYYYDSTGENRYFPLWKNAFVIKADLNLPLWVSTSICYQIFPDRFYNSRSDLGVKTGDYEFNGALCKARKWEDAVLSYNEGRCVDFYNGDLYGIAEKIPHLKELGVTSIYLNPIFSSLTTHRYDCTDYFNVDSKLGGNEAYIYLIRKMHENGIKVICDVSINHTGSNHLWFIDAKNGGEFTDFYYKRNDGNFIYWAGVETLPQLNYNSDKLKNIIYKNKNSVLKKYLNEPFNQDGWRLDVANEVGNTETDFLCHKVWKDVRHELKKEKKDVYLVGEDWEDSSVFLDGSQWDATMNYFGCSRPIRRWMGERDVYACTDYNTEIENAFNAYEMAESLNNALTSLKPQMIFMQMNLIDSHDISRLYNHKEIFDIDIYFGCLMLQFLLPGMPTVYYGDEIALDGSIDSNEGCRYPMNWNKDKWNLKFFEFYKSLSSLRKKYEEIIKNGFFSIRAISDSILLFTRYTDCEELTLILNKSEDDTELNLLDILYFKDFYFDDSDKSNKNNDFNYIAYNYLDGKMKIDGDIKSNKLSLMARKSVIIYSSIEIIQENV